MYGLPPDIDLSFFHNRTLEQVCIGAADLILHFDEGVSLTVTSSIGWVGPHGARNTYEDFPQAASAVAGLLSDVVVLARGNPEGTLTLEFRKGAKLEFYDDSKQYESYVIKSKGKEIVV